MKHGLIDRGFAMDKPVAHLKVRDLPGRREQ